MIFAEERKTVLSSGPNCLSFAPIAGILKIVFFENGQFSYALVSIYIHVLCMYCSMCVSDSHLYPIDLVVFLWCLQTGSVASSCNPASGRSDIGTMWGGEFWLCLIHVELASALRLASTWSSWGSPRSPGCLRRGAPGQRGNPAAKSFHVDQ